MINEPQSQLSEREQAILRLVATGLSNQQIANQLGISVNTVKVHLRNVFGKIGAASRTEATLYAVRTGLVEVERAAALPPTVPVSPPSVLDEPSEDPTAPIDSALVAPTAVETADEPIISVSDTRSLPHAVPVPARRARRRRWPLLVVPLLVALLVASGVLASNALRRGETISSDMASPAASPSAATSWQTLPNLPAPRAAFATASSSDYIYVIGGENADGVLGSVARYDARAGVWTERSAKPTPVTDVRAVRIGDKLYVPGGRTDSTNVTNVFERYDPRAERWETLKPLPAPRSGYALAALEGKLYLFGGWDGTTYRHEVYEYDPDRDTWRELVSMPTARAFAEAGVVEGNIYVIGGENDQGPLANNEVYTPAQEDDQPWSTRAPMPMPRTRFGSATALSIVHVVGGDTAAPPLHYETPTDRWETLAPPPEPIGQHPGVVQHEAVIMSLGGKLGETYSEHTQAYRALFTVFAPRQ